METLDPQTLEAMTIDAFDRVREQLGEAGGGALRFSLEIVRDQARVDERGTWFTLRLIVWEVDGDRQSIRDVKEQEVVVIPAAADDERIPAYLDGLALGVHRMMTARAVDVETMMPHDFIPFRPFRDPSRTTAEAFAACVGLADPNPENVPLDDLTGTTPIAVNPELERAIEVDPERLENFLVYADWLTEHGDPRGELIACTAPAASPAARRRSAKLLADNERYFAGNFMPYDGYGVGLTWELGWIRAAWIGLEHEVFEKSPKLAEQATGALFALPSSKFLHALTIGCIDYEGDCNFDRLYPLFGPRPTLRELFIGDTNSEQQELSWTHAGDCEVLNRLFPNLTKLKIRAGTMQLGTFAYPRLESLVIESGGLAVENVRAIAAAHMPLLRELEIWFGQHGYGATSSFDDIAPLLGGERLPKLERLALRNAEFTDDICRAIGRAPILRRIRELDLSMGVMTDDGAQLLVASADKLSHLTKLSVGANYLTEPALEALKSIGIEVASTYQRREYSDGSRYASIGE